MEALKIILPSAERKPCVCGATLFRTNVTRPHSEPIWLCSRHCGARGHTYAGALRRNAQKLIAAEDESEDEFTLQ